MAKAAAITGWEPFGDFPGLGDWSRFRELPLSRLVPEFFERDRTAPPEPPIDVLESEQAYLVYAELPGVKRENLTVECKNGTLTLRGEKKSEREQTGQKGRVLERRFGPFSRSFSLPKDADADTATASFQDGVLRIEVPKKAEATPQRITIQG